jgi:uncharacterized membrane protein
MQRNESNASRATKTKKARAPEVKSKEPAAALLTQRALGPLVHPAARRLSSERRSNALGWLSIGLGMAQLLAPRKFAQLIGADPDEDAVCLALRMVGGRELVSGVGLLSQARPASWAWMRVAGDVLDLALVGRALQSRGARRDRLLFAGAGVLGVACVDTYTALRLQREGGDVGAEGIAVREAITIARTPEDVYAFFRDFENLPRWLSHLQSVRVDGMCSHWRAQGPLGSTIDWDAEIVEDRPGQGITWRSLPNADIPNQGRVQFRRLGEHTELEVELRYDPPVGKVGEAFARLFGVAPGQQISADLRRLKQVLETGEVLHSDASIHRGRHPARPSGLSAQLSEQVRS